MTIRALSAGSSICALSLLVLFLLFVRSVQAGHDTPPTFHSPVPLQGWAWSGGTDSTNQGGIGWISFNCSNSQTVDVGSNPPAGPYPGGTCGYSNYGVQINPDYTLSGYAWSSNVGWIQFGNGLDLSGAPNPSAGQARINPLTNELEGWARACAVNAGGDCSGPLTVYGGAWDGWISLNAVNTSGAINYGVTVGNGIMDNFAWGADIFGWIDFRTSLGSVTYVPPCTPTTQCVAEEVVGTNEWCTQQVLLTCDTAVGEYCDPNPSPNCVMPTITGYTLTVDRPFVRSGDTVEVSWGLTVPEEADSCYVTSNGGDTLAADISNAEGELIGNSGATSNPITNPVTIFTLTCLPAGSTIEIDLGTVEVNLLPSVSET